MSNILKNIIQPYIVKRKILIIFILLIVIICFSISNILIPKYIIESQNDIFKNIKFLKTNFLNFKIFKNIYFLFILLLIFPIVYLIKQRLLQNFIVNINSKIGIGYIKKLLEHKIKNFSEIDETKFIQLYGDSFYQYMGLIKIFVEYIFPITIVFILITLYFFISFPEVGILLIIHTIILFFVMYNSLKKNNKLALIHYEAQQKNLSIFNDKLKNLLNIIFDDCLDKEMEDVKKENDQTMLAVDNHFKSCDYSTTKLHIINYLLLLLVFLIIIFKLKNNIKIDSKKILITIFIIVIYITQISNCFLDLPQFSRVLSYHQRVENEIKYLIKNNFNSKFKNKMKFNEIKLRNVNFKYKNSSHYLFKDLSIDFFPNKINVIFGTSGSGKTTLMKLIVKLYPIPKGNIFYNNISINDIANSVILDNIYYINQRTILFNKTVLENIQYGNKRSLIFIKNLIKKYQLEEVFKNIPNYLNFNCGVNGYNLSGGMQKVIMNLRGVLKENKNIIIFDEPLSSLDKTTKSKILKMIYTECFGKTIIIISHDDEVLSIADKVIKF